MVWPIGIYCGIFIRTSFAEEWATDGFFLGNVIPAGDAVPADPVGRAGKKMRIIRENGRKTLSDLLIYAILPCNIVASFMGGITLPDGFVHNCFRPSSSPRRRPVASSM